MMDQKQKEFDARVRQNVLSRWKLWFYSPAEEIRSSYVSDEPPPEFKKLDK